MVTNCCVRGCNSVEQPSCGFSWVPVPHTDKIQREKWLKFIMNVEDVPADLDEQKTENWRMCSLHFEPKLIQREYVGKAQKAKLRIGAVPTIRTTSSGKRMLPESRSCEESEPHTKTQRMDVEVKAVTSEALQVIPLQGSVSNETLSSLRNVVHDLRQARKDKVCAHAATPQQSKRSKEEIERLQKKNGKLKEALLVQKEKGRKVKELEEEIRCLLTEKQRMKRQIEALESNTKATKFELHQKSTWCTKLQDELDGSKFRYNNLKKDPVLFLYFTGFKVERFETLFDFLGGEACEEFLYMNRTKIVNTNASDIPKFPLARQLTARDQLLMLLCRLRFRHGMKDLGSRFHVSRFMVSQVCKSWIPKLKKCFKEAGIWPEGNESKYRNAPENLKPLYQKIKLLIEGIKKEDNQVKTNNPKEAIRKRQLEESGNASSSHEEEAMIHLEGTNLLDFLDS